MLTLKNIKFATQEQGNKIILQDINFTFEKGKNYVITGANGCGKSTLAKVIMGIYPAASGQIIFNGRDISKLDTTARARLGIAFAFQQPVRFKGLTARDMISTAYNSRFIGTENDTPKNRLTTSQACEYLSLVGLCAREYLDRELDNTLSGGELKRIEIASVLARNCELNIFDEPEAGIDIWSFNSLVNIFKRTIDKNRTNIIISHQEKLINSADVVILIADGRIVLSGAPNEVMPAIRDFKSCEKLKIN